MSVKIVFIRHCMTDWNKQRRYLGCKDINLNRLGEIQALRLRRRLKHFMFDRIYSSDRKRCLQTARIIFDGAKVIKTKDLREINFGAIEGLRHPEIIKRYGAIYKNWLINPFKNHIPGVETLPAFRKRVRLFLRKIVSINQDKTVAIVCHAGTIGVFISGLLRDKDFWRCVPSPGSITIVEYDKGKYKIKLFADARHLK